MAHAWEEEGASSKKNTPDDNPSKQKSVETDKNNLLVKIIEDDTQFVNIRLGITDKRKTELHAHLAAAMIKDHEIGIILTNLSKHCNHANELAYIAFALGRRTNESSKKDSIFGSGRIKAISIGKNGIEGLGDGEDLPDFIKDILKDILNKDKNRGKDKDKE